MVNKIYSFLGLATRAGKLVSGEEACERAIRSGKVELIIVAEDASANTKKKFTNMSNFRTVPLRFYGEKENIGRYTGKQLRSVISVMDKGFAGRFIEIIDQEKNEMGGDINGKA